MDKYLYMCSSCSWKVFSTVDADEIRRLGKRFRKLDLDGSGTLSVDEFMSLPELQQNPLVQRVIEIFDTDGNKEIDFKGLLVIFHLKIMFPFNLSLSCVPKLGQNKQILNFREKEEKT